MRIRVVGCGWYGAHLAVALLRDGHDVEVHDSADKIFAGASGGNPARLHKGFHYPRSRLTRAACQDHGQAFEAAYGSLTRGVPVNVYAIAARDSLVDFGTYTQLLRGEVEFITIADPAELGIVNVEGAVLTGERHVLIDAARAHFERELDGRISLRSSPFELDDDRWDLTLDCTFCANDAENIDRFEPCVTVLLQGPTERAVTIMDGGFPSLFPWNEAEGLSSLTSASLTPLSKTCRTYRGAREMLDGLTGSELATRGQAMLRQMAEFWPAAPDLYRAADYRLSIRAMPRSAADARLVDVVRVGQRALRVRAGKIDAIFHAERVIKDMIRR